MTFELQEQVTVQGPTGPALLAAPALFGPELLGMCIHAPATLAEPPHGCEPYADASLLGQVVIVQRGECTFVEKVRSRLFMYICLLASLSPSSYN